MLLIKEGNPGIPATWLEREGTMLGVTSRPQEDSVIPLTHGP